MARGIEFLDSQGRLVPSPRPASLASSQLAWHGAPLEVTSLHGDGELGPSHAAFPTIAWSAGGRGHTDVKSGSRRLRLPFGPGHLVMNGPTFEIDHAHWRGADVDEVISVQLRPDVVEALAPGAVRSLDVALSTPIVDPTVSQLVSLMRDELQEGCLSGRLYAEGLTMALAGHLQSRYGCIAASVRAPGQLSPRELARVTDYVQQGLGRDLGVNDLAGLLHMSAAHFSRMFRKTTGFSPYRFLQEQRIERARALLPGSLPLAEIAQSVGIADQSRFTQMFRRVVGTTPGRLRTEIRKRPVEPQAATTDGHRCVAP